MQVSELALFESFAACDIDRPANFSPHLGQHSRVYGMIVVI